jgi:hypothetical protein
MKKLKPFILASLLTLPLGVLACGPFVFTASDYRIYRIVPNSWSLPTIVHDDFETKNIILWSQQTGCKDTADIRRAVYEGSLADWEAVYRYMKDDGNELGPLSKNRFVRDLVKKNDMRAVEVLYGSKRYETIRNMQRSPWYYDSHIETDDKVGLMETYRLIDNGRLNDKRYGDRFKFLAMKCAWALGEDATVLLMWEKFQKSIKFKPIRYQAEDYVARTFERMGLQRLADSIYSSNCNYTELLPYNASTPTALKILLQHVPNSLELTYRLQKYISFLDREQASSWPADPETAKTDSVLAIARGAIVNPKVHNKTQWRYAAACILDYHGKPKEALSMLKGAENGECDKFMRNSVRILRFYLRTKTATVNDIFERWAIGEVKWMHDELKQEWRQLSDEKKDEIKKTDGSPWGKIVMTDDLYCQGALCRIVLDGTTGLAAKLAAAGRSVRALQIANMTENWIFELTDNDVLKKVRTTTDSTYWVYFTGSDGKYHSEYINTRSDTAMLDGHDFHIWSERKNWHDYNNPMFELADRMTASTLERYRETMLHPQNNIDRWLNSHSYTDRDYWEDIIGTHYLRERNYKAAATHLKMVSPTYQRRMNLRCWLNPFSIDRSSPSLDSTCYKLHFALRMDSLEQAMLHEQDADARGLAMLEYSIGLQNSFGNCWWLTSYQKGWNLAKLIDITETPYARQAELASNHLRIKAIHTLKTDEARARYYARIGHYRKLRLRYPNSETARQYALVCDGGWMYSKNRKIKKS